MGLIKMAGALVEVKIEDEELREILGRVIGHLEDTKPMMADIGEIVTESVMRNFEEKRAPDGTPWKPLSEVTKARKLHPEHILIETTTLRDSIHPEASADRVEIGTDIVYAAVHQFGIGERSVISSRRRMPEIPARPFLGVRDDDWDEIKETVREYLVSD